MKNYSSRKGFTLAEVLITLAIIGVVAAMTIPVLVAIDINGKKGPNKWGYDLFSFMLMFDGSRLYYGDGGCMHIEKGGVSSATMIQRLQKNQL